MLDKIKELYGKNRLMKDNNAVFKLTFELLSTIFTIIAIIIGIVIVIWIITNPPVLIALAVLVVIAILAKKYLLTTDVAQEA